ncbi:MAG: hypothetical protein M4D80_13615 [Myxococcota bacterium]|nr:hypothetical protein [Myxococcota bacterium]
MLRALAVVLVLCGAARAQVKAVSVESTRTSEHRHQHPPSALGIDLVVGWAGQRGGRSGWSARLDYELFPFFDPGKSGGFFGFMPGFEVWGSGDDNWGFSLPFGIVAGAKLFPMRATLGFGFDAVLVDQVDDDTGFGLWAPFALAKLGVDVHGVQVGADARIGYRWQIGADDHARWQLGIYAGYTVPPRNKPRR